MVLPSGKAIEVACVRQDLHLCLKCQSDLVYPVGWEQAGEETWSVLLQCPNCQTSREGVFDERTLQRFDEQMDLGADALTRAYRGLMRANMSDEIDRFEAALRADAILPEDF